jgi:hypothetical protein
MLNYTLALVLRYRANLNSGTRDDRGRAGRDSRPRVGIARAHGGADILVCPRTTFRNGSQWVPLQYVTWGWSAEVEYAPNIPDNPTSPFLLRNSERHPPGQPVNSSDHPIWEHNMADPSKGGENAIIDDPDQSPVVLGT